MVERWLKRRVIKTRRNAEKQQRNGPVTNEEEDEEEITKREGLRSN